MRFLASSWGQRGPEIVVSPDFMVLPMSFREAAIWHEVGHIHYEHHRQLEFRNQSQLRTARISAIQNGEAMLMEAQADRFAVERVGSDVVAGFLAHLLKTRPRGGESGWNDLGCRELELRIAAIQASDSSVPASCVRRSRVDGRWHFAYGSNLAIDQKEYRTGRIRDVRRACLSGYRIVFNKLGSDGTGKANITPDSTHVVWGAAYLSSPTALKRMDDYEEVAGGHYHRENVQIRCEPGGVLEAITYVAGERHVQSPISPALEYLHQILSGARHHALPEDYVREIQQAAQDTE